ncbi:UNVERIFIED_CONTAM: hypothetical protein HDU68_008661 [Siphonaria sp. JEL0065]|nr:hypothetical protein HDU68_008661 [Siphonaria sp. JEL0065]
MLAIVVLVAAVALPLAAAEPLTVSSTCELLVDDMRPRTANQSKNDSFGNVKTLNLNGGDYGVDGGSKLQFNFAASNGHVDVIPGWDKNPGDGDAALHPPAILASNYFYYKFVWDDQKSSNDFGVNVCQDLSVYQGLYLNVSMPAGSDVYLTLTQKNAACSARTKDSAYVKLSQFHTPNGTPQSIFIPFDLMKLQFDGQPYDFTHAKDATFVNFSPSDVTYSFYHIGLVKNGASCTPKTGGVSTGTGTGVPAQTTAKATSSAEKIVGGLVSFLGALFLV